MQDLSLQHSPREKEAWLSLLADTGLKPEKHLDRVLGVYEGGQLVATAARFHNVLKCFAIHPDYRGGPLFNELASTLIRDISRQGFDRSSVYTNREGVQAFAALGFQEIAHVNDRLFFLERARQGFDDYLSRLAEHRTGLTPTAAVVVNANPFTLGHRTLIETARRRCRFLHLFVLSEDLSEFTAAERRLLVERGTADLDNIQIHDTDEYLVSAATFPSYFLQEEDDVTSLHARLDALLFIRIAEALGISRRFVGEEPLSRATALYNQAMAREFAGHLDFIVIPRREIDGVVISASEVRRCYRQRDFQTLARLVPPTTLDYLRERAGKEEVF